ncbi:hypothetical protein KL919_005197 [Ogataea angusta]|nr:hypothetical protein KL909_004682 [Ogataea angusta]KAG7827914.1 hypothetical protein KL920_004164 [Ogataea angusta]KAG7836912.1 hypothetical protein KL943_000951 [Ogataea angusta]KAG7853044.1 hypothetical protein KL941_000094 [Ogataea angusta]KAG7854403.1 hypothetical protein KL919_005197 [Ogataea angusta]
MATFDPSILQSILNKTKPESSENVNVVEVPPFQEWRFEVAAKDKLKLKLVDGTAEIFGTELSPNIEYAFQGSVKLCVFSFSGCKLQFWNCQPLSEYVSEESCVGQYLTLHLGLEKQRVVEGPRVLVIGGKDSGKTALCRTLASYAEKQDHQPMLVNLNPRDFQFVIPGNLSATAISDLFNLENVALGESVTTGPSFYHQKQPLAKTFGLEKFSDNVKLYRYLIQQLGKSVRKRLDNDIKVKKSGVIVDTPAFTIKEYDIIEEIVSSFNINVLLIVGSERLLVDLKKKMQNPAVTLLKLNKSSGCVDKDDKYERELQQRSIKEYFYGIDRLQLSPYSITVNLKDFIFVRPKETENVNLSFLSGDLADDDEAPRESVNYKQLAERVKNPGSDTLNNSILSLVDDSQIDTLRYLNSDDDDENLIKPFLDSSSLGFCYVQNCNDEKGKLTLLVPSPVQQLPTRTLLLTQFRYHE